MAYTATPTQIRHLLRSILAIAIAILVNAKAEASPDRPLVFVPGILGSILKQGDRTLWGTAGALRTFTELRIPNGPKNPADGVKATDVIRELQILGPWKVDQYNTLIESLRSNGYELNKTLFLFPYDWRQSNETSATLLRDFVERTAELKGKKFDILAHSMGGFVSRLFIEDTTYGRNVVNFITMATPFYGSTNTLKTLDSGWGAAPNWIAGGMDTIRATVLSWPAIYEMLPTYKFCCIQGLPADPSRKSIDIMTESNWFQLKWLPEAALPPNYKSQVAAALRTARRVRDIMLKPVPTTTKNSRLAGERNDTSGQFYFDPATGSVVKWRDFNGDGTVIVRSASLGSPETSYASFSKHQTIFENELVLAQIERALGVCHKCGPINYAGEIPSLIASDGTIFNARRASVSVNPPVVSPTEELFVEVSVMADANDPVEQISVSGSMNAIGRSPTPLNFDAGETNDDIDDATKVRIIRFKAKIAAPADGGPAEVRVKLSGLKEDLLDQFIVVPPS